MKRLIAPLVLLLSCAVATAAETSFTSTLSPDDLKATGLDGLSAEQIQRLDALVEHYRSAEVKREVVKAEKKRRVEEAGLEFEHAIPRLESRIVGTVDGWSGGTTFTLENGQIWKLANRETYIHYKNVKNPPVVLEKATFGNYWLRIDGFPGVRVRRVK